MIILNSTKIRIFIVSITLLLFTLVMYGCGSQATDEKYLEGDARDRSNPLFGESIFGEGGLQLFGGDSVWGDDNQGSGIGVNSFLWRASLDAMSFMPLSSADPFGGVIITEWFGPPDVEGERFKMTVYILGRVLRADALKVSLFKQIKSQSGDWADAKVSPETITNLENRILERARQLKTVQADN
ncbi:MAG: hypothetical protein CL567_02790 [Alphaproteobacteria bacterium]|nr:hypothetical protein [Alphaproteobacteria bacterium]